MIADGNPKVENRIQQPGFTTAQAQPVLLAQTVIKRTSSAKTSTQMKKVDTQEEKIQALEREVADLKAENARLRSAIYEARKALERVK